MAVVAKANSAIFSVAKTVFGADSMVFGSTKTVAGTRKLSQSPPHWLEGRLKSLMGPAKWVAGRSREVPQCGTSRGSVAALARGAFELRSGCMVVARGLESRLLGDHAGAQGEAHQAGDVEDVEPFHQSGAVILDGLGADLEDEGDGFGGLAFGDELEDFPPARGQLLHGGFGRCDFL